MALDTQTTRGGQRPLPGCSVKHCECGAETKAECQKEIDGLHIKLDVAHKTIASVVEWYSQGGENIMDRNEDEYDGRYGVDILDEALRELRIIVDPPKPDAPTNGDRTR